MTQSSRPGGRSAARAARGSATSAGSSPSTRPIATCSSARGDGAPEGVVAVADEQTAGRGRLGRTWVAPPGSALLVSVLLRPAVPVERVHLVTLAAGLAALDAIDVLAAGPRPGSSGRTTWSSTTASSRGSSPRPTARARSSSAWGSTCGADAFAARAARRSRPRVDGRPGASCSSAWLRRLRRAARRARRRRGRRRPRVRRRSAGACASSSRTRRSRARRPRSPTRATSSSTAAS